MEQEVLTVAEVARLLAVSTWKVYDLCNRNTMPHRRVGRVIRFSKDAIMQWLGGTAKNSKTSSAKESLGTDLAKGVANVSGAI